MFNPLVTFHGTKNSIREPFSFVMTSFFPFLLFNIYVVDEGIIGFVLPINVTLEKNWIKVIKVNLAKIVILFF